VTSITKGYVVGLAVGAFFGAGHTYDFMRVRAQPRPRTSSDVIFACLQKQGMPVYAVGPDGPPPVGKPLTAEMFTVICVEEK
jgi:hypothetical protein